MSRRPVLLLITAMAAALGLAEPAVAAPATRAIQLYASATGSGIACTAAHPSALTTARDEVWLLVPFQSRRSGGYTVQLFQTWKLDTCPAGQPVFAVKFSRRYRWVEAGNVTVTVLLLAGLNV